MSVDGRITHYFSCPLTADDSAIFDIPLGVADGQQLWECFAVLVAVDIWTAHWSQARIVLKVRGDNVGALTLLVKMRPSSPKLAIIARELALRLVKLSFPPDAIHTPGVAHVLADKLSRIHAPGGTGTCVNLHPAIAQAAESVAPRRTPEWYRALDYEPAVSRW